MFSKNHCIGDFTDEMLEVEWLNKISNYWMIVEVGGPTGKHHSLQHDVLLHYGIVGIN